ncbi:hypothetical protein HUU05_29655 [candidate division KSB1 bacterium]|nr:hypothetical protein [candidate division KSB1 bacterium]
MITGRITEDLEPILDDAFIRRHDETLVPVRTILDTGFNGWFCMPKEILEQMVLKPAAREVFQLADGSNLEEQTYVGEVIVANQPFLVLLMGTDAGTALMGMRMLLEKEALFNLKDMTIKVV